MAAAHGVNWLGDSLHGTLARVRGTQHPKYGIAKLEPQRFKWWDERS